MTHKFIQLFLLTVLGVSVVFAGPGDLDTTFAGDGKIRLGFNKGDDIANGAVTQADGKLVVVGSAPNGIAEDYLVIRYNVDGSLDASFGTGGRVITHVGALADAATAVALQPDGKIVVAGFSIGNGTNQDFAVVRYNTDGSLDSTFGVGGKQVTAITNSIDAANALTIQSDGKIVLAGYSYTNNSSGDIALVRYNTNGSVDTTFGQTGKSIIDASLAGFHDIATGIVTLPDGKLFIVGEGNGISYFVRCHGDGGRDFGWGVQGVWLQAYSPGATDATYAVALQPDGKVVTAGVTGGKFVVVRWGITGLDLSFGTNGKKIFAITDGGHDVARSIMITGTTSQRIVVAGSTNIGGQEDFAIARLDLSGNLDTSFNGTGKVVPQLSNGDDRINAIVPQAGGIAVAGSTFNGSNLDFGVARYMSSGGPDNSFDTDGKRTDDVGYLETLTNATVIQPDGKILVSGYTLTNADARDFAIARYHPNGTLDTSFDHDGKATTDFGASSDESWSIALQPDGKILVAGSRWDPSAQAYDFAIARYNTDGSPDNSFNGNGRLIAPIGPSDDEGAAVAVQADGKIVVAGTVKPGGTQEDFAVARFNANGTPDNNFGSGGKLVFPIGLGDDIVNAMKIQSDGKIVVSGETHNGTNTDFAIARVTTSGTLDNTFGAFGRQTTPIGPQDDHQFGMALQPDGKIIVTGYAINNTTSGDMAVVRYTTAGQPDPTFDNDGIALTRIGLIVSAATAAAVQADGKIVVTGVAVIGTGLDFAAARFMPNGSLDGSYGIGGKAIVDLTGRDDFGRAMALDAQGRAVIAGDGNGLMGITRLAGDLVTRTAPFDFDGDGKSDVSIFRPANGEWWVLKSGDSGNFAVQFGNSTDKVVPADFTGDGKTDVAFFRPSVGAWFVLRSENLSFYSFPFGTAGDIPVPADYDGDGKADAAVFRPSSATWFILRSSNHETMTVQFGATGDHPVPADYDGDGKVDVAIRRPSNGEWWLNRSRDGVIAFSFGTGTDSAVPADYTGDGKADVAFWRPSSGQWTVMRSENFSFYSFPFGTMDDVPAAADYDGDGKTDAAVFRPSSSNWFVNKTSGGVLTLQFGAAGDQPVPAAFLR